MKITTKDNNLSHNLYYEEKKIEYRQLPKYLIKSKKEIIATTNITDALEIAIGRKTACDIFQTKGASHEWTYYCTVSGEMQ